MTDTLKGCRDMLREAAKQFRLHDDAGHARMCELHANALEEFIKRHHEVGKHAEYIWHVSREGCGPVNEHPDGCYWCGSNDHMSTDCRDRELYWGGELDDEHPSDCACGDCEDARHDMEIDNRMEAAWEHARTDD